MIPTKNGELTALMLSKSSAEKRWFHCEDCNHNFNISIDMINSGSWCRYCSSTNWKHCGDDDCKWCLKRSFASHPKALYWNKTKNDINILKVALHAINDYWFKCDKCNHDFSLAIYNITGKRPAWCCYCSNSNWKHCGDKECDWCLSRSIASHPKAAQWHEDNDYNILEVSRFSKKKCKFTCEDCGFDFTANAASVSIRHWCPACKNKTETKILKWLTEKFPNLTIIHQVKFDWCKSVKNNYLPFDFLLEELKLIISLDGDQHFKQVLNWKTPEHTQARDIYKMFLALEN